MIGEILSALNILEKVSRFVNWIFRNRSAADAAATETVSSRFLHLFESYDVHRNQIPRFFGHGLMLKDVQDEASLLDKLDEPLLDSACQLFGVRREWLEGAESLVYPCHDFYKHPESVAPFLTALKERNPDGGLDGVLISPIEKHGDAVVVLSEVIGWVGEKEIYRYHLCNNWLFDYWKSRAYLTAFVATAWKHGVYIRGRSLPGREIKRIAEGQMLLASAGEGLPGCGGSLWYPEDMALSPDAFLSGVDPERGQHGLKSALERWLHLEKQGYMDTGLQMYSKDDIRTAFEQALSGLHQ